MTPTLVVMLVMSVAVFGIALLVVLRRGDRTCPTCDVPYEVVAEAHPERNATYDVLACPRCANTATLVHGAHAGHLAYCPACSNQTLETATVRLPGEGLAVEIREACRLCGYARTLTVGDDAPMAQVIPFPTAVRRRRAEPPDDPTDG